MTLRLHNTLTRQVEPLVPVHPGRVSLYTCGPTVYNYAHVGNFRTFLFEDLLRRWLEASGLAVLHVMNLTDVDDKTIKGALAAGQPLAEHTARFVQAFHEDRDWLRIRPPHEEPRATGYIAEQVALVESLLAKGVAYRGDDGSVYFSIASFPAYGRLSQLDRRELRAGASGRVSADEYAKEDAQDFVLWKAARPEDEQVGAAWDAPFGRGRPGWHLECSAMALAILARHGWGDVLDIHAGGVDLIFPHHEDEIAQSCAHTGQPHFARIWLHGEFLNIRGQKMSKRWGNVTTARDLREDGVDPAAFRLLVFQTHYRQRLDLTDEALAAAGEGARRLGEFRDRLRGALGQGGTESPAFVAAAAAFRQEFATALDDDLTAPRAVAAFFEFVRAANRLLDEREAAGPAAAGALDLAEAVLDVCGTSSRVAQGGGVVPPTQASGSGRSLDPTPPASAQEAVAWAGRWAEARVAAKADRNFAEADRIRGLLAAAGFEVRDLPGGQFELRRNG